MKNQIANRLKTSLIILDDIKDWFDPEQDETLAMQIIEIDQAIKKAIEICERSYNYERF